LALPISSPHRRTRTGKWAPDKMTTAMFIGAWIRQLREQRGLSQADVERVTGLLRGYISRVENGRTVPSLETLERLAAALDVPLYQLFYMTEEAQAVSRPRDIRRQAGEGTMEDRFLLRFRELWGRLKDSERELLLGVAKRLADRYKSFRA
jgi:transcriptional regulator with XRE-family HTH domain